MKLPNSIIVVIAIIIFAGGIFIGILFDGIPNLMISYEINILELVALIVSFMSLVIGATILVWLPSALERRINNNRKEKDLIIKKIDDFILLLAEEHEFSRDLCSSKTLLKNGVARKILSRQRFISNKLNNIVEASKTIIGHEDITDEILSHLDEYWTEFTNKLATKGDKVTEDRMIRLHDALYKLETKMNQLQLVINES